MLSLRRRFKRLLLSRRYLVNIRTNRKFFGESSTEALCFSAISGVSVGIRTHLNFGLLFLSRSVMAHVRPTLQPHVKCFPFCKERNWIRNRVSIWSVTTWNKYSLSKSWSWVSIIFQISWIAWHWSYEVADWPIEKSIIDKLAFLQLAV